MNLFSFFIDFLLEMPITKLLPVINLCTQKLFFFFFIIKKFYWIIVQHKRVLQSIVNLKHFYIIEPFHSIV